jgi:HPt (histidine-containing phosphotransfer) domain-containing protein
VIVTCNHAAQSTGGDGVDVESASGSVTALPVLDRVGALERVGGDTALLEELLGMLLEQIAAGMPEMSCAMEQGDAPKLEHLAHGLKGAAASLGAERFRQCAFELEQIGRSRNLAPAAAALARLAAEEQALRTALAT